MQPALRGAYTIIHMYFKTVPIGGDGGGEQIISQRQKETVPYSKVHYIGRFEAHSIAAIICYDIDVFLYFA